MEKPIRMQIQKDQPVGDIKALAACAFSFGSSMAIWCLRRRVMKISAAIAVVCTTATGLTAFPAVSPVASKQSVSPVRLHGDWFKIATQLGSGEIQSAQAVAKLQALSRPEMVKAVRSWLSEPDGEVQAIAYHVVTALDLKVMHAELMKSAAKSKSWRLFQTLNSISTEKDKAQVISLYETRLKSDLPPPAMMAVIDGFSLNRAPLSPELFRQLLQSPSFEVRDAVVHNLIATRSELAAGEQVARLRSSLVIKPYQVRLAAYQYFDSLPPSDQLKLRLALSADACAKEANAKVKSVCAKLVESGKADHP